jgi:methylthioribose-1-phosphate isomerase
MAKGDEPADSQDASRREFFRTFSRQTVQSAGAMVGAASEIRRTSMAAAREIFDPTMDAIAPARAQLDAPPVEPVATAEWTFRSPYRFTGDGLVILDQRDLPGRVTTLSVREPAEVASAMRGGAITAGPVLAEVGAYAMVLAAQTAADRPVASRQQIMGAASGTLRGARRDVQALTSAVARMEARHDELVAKGADPSDISHALHAEADAITTEATIAHSAIGRRAAELFASPKGIPIQLLMHGDTGPLSCGTIGMGTAMIQALTEAGHAVHAWVTEAAPTGEGGRITSLQLARNDVAHTVIPDSAVGWLFSSRTIDAVLLRGDRVCTNGDTGALIGSLVVAQLAHTAGVPVYVLADVTSIDSEAADGDDIRARLGSSAEILAEKRATEGSNRPAVSGVRLNPTADVVPAELISVLVTARPRAD